MIEIKEGSEPAGESATIRNVELKKNVQLKASTKVGDIAHYHAQEDETKRWEEACLVVEYQIRDEKGFRINDDRYVGKVIVSQCLADHFAYMDSVRAAYENNVFRGKITTRNLN